MREISSCASIIHPKSINMAIKLIEGPDFSDPDIIRPMKYAHDAYGNPLEAPEGYKIIRYPEDDTTIMAGDIHFDVYGGWVMEGAHPNSYHVRNGHHVPMGGGGYSDAMGRWTCYARKLSTKS